VIKLNISVPFIAIRNALGEPGLDWLDNDVIEIEGVEVEEYEIDAAGYDPECDICGGSLPDEPGPQVDPRLIADFIAAINHGDLVTARALVGRVFDEPSDAALVDNALCRCAQ